MSHKIAVMYDKFIRGCSTLKHPKDVEHFTTSCLEVMDFEDMLNTQYTTDAHFVCYSITNFPTWPRLNKPILREIRNEGEDVVLNYFAFDIDNENHGEWTASATEEFAEKIASIEDNSLLSSWCALYLTKGGARMIYRLSSPIPVDDAEANLCWMLNQFTENLFDGVDHSCKDWTRTMRCPQVIRDKKKTWEAPYYTPPIYRPDRVLEVKQLGKLSISTVAHKTIFKREDNLEMPTFDALERLLQTENPTTRKAVQTDYYKRARRLFKTSPYLDILFNNTPPSWLPGTRNDEIMRMLGIITPMLLKNCFATIQQVFALAVRPLLTLDEVPGKVPPVQHGWNALIDIYEREVNKLNQDREFRASEAFKGISLLEEMKEGMKNWCNHPSLHNAEEEEAREFVRSHSLASVGSYFFTMAKDGYYEPFSVAASQVISRIRKTFLNDIIPTTKRSVIGEEMDITSTQIQNQYSTAVAEILMKPIGDKGGYIEDMNGTKPSLVLSTFSRNDQLKPTYNLYVDSWLKCLFGKWYEIGCQWIGNALAFDEGLICALSLEGASNAGKKLLSVGLSECLKKPAIAGPLDIYQMSGAFLTTPFLVVNEAWPDPKSGMSPADTFKALTGGDGIRVKEIYKPAMTILCPIRVILTANDDGIVRTLTKGKDMTLDNRIAIGERLFHVKVSSKAQDFLREIGGMAFTSKVGGRWIRPDSGSEESDFVVAKHFLWLYHNRDPVDRSQRFLVTGNSAPGRGGKNMTVFEKLLADNNSTPLVAQAIIEMADKRTGIWGRFIRVEENEDGGRIWVTRFGVDRYVREVLNQRVQEKEVFSGMQNILLDNEPDIGKDGNHWYEISVVILAMIASEKGIPQEAISRMAKSQKAGVN